MESLRRQECLADVAYVRHRGPAIGRPRTGDVRLPQLLGRPLHDGTRWAGSDQTTALHHSEGFTKILYEPDTHLVLGVGIVGSNAAELIGEAALAIEMGAVTTDLASTIHPHPTRSEHLSAAARKAETSARAEAAPDDAPGPGPSASPGTG